VWILENNATPYELRFHFWALRRVMNGGLTMTERRRFSVVFSLAAYLLATSAVHALHDHSATGNCRSESQACAGLGSTSAGCDADESPGCHAPHDSPSHSDCEDSCFACRFLAAKSIAAVAVELVQRTEVLQQVVPPQGVSVPAVRPYLPFSRGPPCA
jgi:hypothetical protein